nr:MAG TPA: hypothetical protein [Caudoviricetes sp.]
MKYRLHNCEKRLHSFFDGLSLRYKFVTKNRCYGRENPNIE